MVESKDLRKKIGKTGRVRVNVSTKVLGQSKSEENYLVELV